MLNYQASYFDIFSHFLVKYATIQRINALIIFSLQH
jgi:hypothetical protein